MVKNNVTTTIGTINLNDIEFCKNMLDVFIGIESVSEAMQSKINEAMEIAKADHLQRIKEHFTNKNLYWTDAGVKTNLSLHIIIKDKKFSYRIEIDIEEKGDDRIWASASIEVDLSEYQNELKKAIIKTLVDKFF